MMPATSLLTLGPPNAPGPLGSGWRGKAGGGEGEDLGKGLDGRMGERGTGEETRLTGAEAETKGAADTLSLRDGYTVGLFSFMGSSAKGSNLINGGGALERMEDERRRPPGTPADG